MKPAAHAPLALALGLLAGAAVVASDVPALQRLPALVAPLGALWVNAIRMTVVPLVVSLLVTSVASAAEPSAMGRTGLRALGVFVALLAGIALPVALVAPAIFAYMPVDAEAAARLRAAAADATTAVPGLGEWLVSLVPANAVKAAADGAMLPLIVFTLAFATALAQVPIARREPVVALFRGVSEATLRLIEGVLLLAPVGVFALSMGLGATLGAAAAGSVGFYVGAHSLLLIAAIAVLYPVAVLGGGVSPARFARACLPAQVVAMSTRSSLAALPAMLDGAERVLGLPRARLALVLPLAVTTFRLNQAVSWTAGAWFVSRLYDVPLGGGTLVLVAAASVAMSFAVPGIPSGGLFVMAPFFGAFGLPIEGIGVLIALDPLPDVFKTTLNVTGHMTAATMLARDDVGAAAQPTGVPLTAPLPARRDPPGTP